MSELFHREYSLTVGTKKVTGLRCSFEISKSLTKDPNVAKFKVYNLSEASRNALQPSRSEGRRDVVTLVAGYKGAMGILYSGHVRFVDSARTGPDWVTEITAGDAERAYATQKFSLSFAKGASIKDIFTTAAKTLGVDTGNLKEALTRPFRGGVTTLRKGFAATGDASEVLDAIAHTAGFEMSVQDGKLVLLQAGQVLGEAAFRLGPSTGMVGSPQYGTADAQDKLLGVPPRLKVKSLLQPLLGCGRAVQLDSRAYAGGTYRVEKATHTGDTHDTPWYTEVELKLIPGGARV